MSKMETMSSRVGDELTPIDWNQKNLGELLSFRHLSPSRFVCDRHDSNLNGMAYGGQLLAQALHVTQSCVDDLMPSSINVVFVDGGRIDRLLEFQVEPIKRSRRFARYRVTAFQRAGDGTISTALEAYITFQADMQAYAYSEPMPENTPPPEALVSMDQLPGADIHNWGKHQKPCLEMRLVDPDRCLEQRSESPRMAFWVRLRERLPEAKSFHYSAIAYLSDFWVNGAAIMHQVPLLYSREEVFAASLNHSLWFYGSCRADDWLLMVAESPCMQMGRALTHLKFYDRQARLIACASQDCLVLKQQ